MEHVFDCVASAWVTSETKPQYHIIFLLDAFCYRNVKILTIIPSPFSFGSGFMTMFSNILKANKTVLLADFDEHSYFSCIEVSGK